MRYRNLVALAGVSRLILGLDHQANEAALYRACADFIALGGNAFDTAYQYLGWRERALSTFLRHEGLSKSVTVIVKGGHSPLCTPSDVERQLAISLENLGLDSARVFLLHRDNPGVPVGEFVDCLSRQRESGRIGCFGASNWSRDRLDEANAYAARNGLPGMSVVSNQFGLAPMLRPFWQGALSSASGDFMAWHLRTQTPLLAYTPLGRGFLSEAAKNRDRGSEVAQCFDSSESRERRERAKQLAVTRRCSLVDIALAYVLCQPFPTFAIVGPRSLEQLISSIPSLDVALSASELAWLQSGKS